MILRTGNTNPFYIFEYKGGKFNIPVSISVFVIVAVYVSHHYLDELVMGVQWFATEVVTPVFDLDQYF